MAVIECGGQGKHSYYFNKAVYALFVSVRPRTLGTYMAAFPLYVYIYI